MMKQTETLELESRGLKDLPRVAKEIAEFAQDQTVWLFEGHMGAGKTTLIKEICDLYGVVDLVNSPTFSIVNEYASADDTFYHFDFYRLREEEEALDIGFEEYVSSGHLCLIEWPSKIPSFIPDEYLLIEIEAIDESRRQIKVSKIQD
ncbi:tRNA (adenosine(37)-N6)-threonylcarbamoyltransferase complex ATPase subunit type 1 TsaE [Sediminitomix flava]|uniref:tRNA threonylcarbamoyladenosine biosynthesis protein TsaE n=1 Tax=Sediminitomix flava TaxID=379075 RepID=A0A315Z6T0_SEDFL|nr:tRNA (adenosine(37)-N6)-threonylcarbamoyltransferase complex ATPase subunit type 1 TsaE [Sediminitomix flava]PWJ39412.1 tRNA threonylcarbamoyladenosine biosynthesis protein TsaE [Sediminitomix flava]